MFRSLAVVIAILTPQAALAQTTGASEPPDGLTWMVLNEINGDYFNRAEPMNHPPFISEPPAGMITPVDVSQDGATDCSTGRSSRSMSMRRTADAGSKSRFTMATASLTMTNAATPSPGIPN